MPKEVVTWLLGGFGAFKLFEPLIMKFIQKKEQEEDSQSLKIEALSNRCTCLERDIELIKQDKVSWKELNKAIEKINEGMNKVREDLSEIKGIIKKEK